MSITAFLLSLRAQRSSAKGDFSNALRLYERLLEECERRGNGKSPQGAAILLSMARTFNELRRLDDAEATCHRILDIQAHTAGLPDGILAATHVLLGDVLAIRGDIGDSLDRFGEALRIAEALHPEAPFTAHICLRLASGLAVSGRFKEALPLHQRALQILETGRGPDHPEVAEGLAKLGYTLGRLGKYEDAIAALQRALAISDKTHGQQSKVSALIRANLASNYCKVGHFDFALSLCENALQCVRQSARDDLPTNALVLNFLAEAHHALGQDAKALPALLEALNYQERTFGNEHPAVAMTLNNLAVSYNALGDYEHGIPAVRRVLAIYERLYGQESDLLAGPLGTLAGFYRAIGQPREALPLLEAALAIHEKHLGRAHQDTIKSLGNLASCLYDLGEADRGTNLTREAISLSESVAGPSHALTATLLGNLAIFYSDSPSERGGALELYERSLRITEAVLGRDHPATTRCLINLAAEYFERGRVEDALQLQLRAVATMTTAYGANYTTTATATAYVALSQHSLGRRTLAIAYLKRAVNASQSQRTKVAVLGSGELTSYTATVADHYQKLAYWLTEEGRLAEALQVLDLLKEDEYFEFIRRSDGDDPRKTRISLTRLESEWLKRYEEISENLATLGVSLHAFEGRSAVDMSKAERTIQQELAEDLKVANAAFASFLEDMRQDFEAKGAMREVDLQESSQANLRDLQALIKALGHDTVLVQYYVMTDKVGILITTPGIQIAREEAIPVVELRRKILSFGRVLRNPNADPLPLARELYELLFKRVEVDLQQANARSVMLSLDGVLRYLPFGALHDGERYLVEKWNFALYSSVVRDRLLDQVAPSWNVAGLGVTKGIRSFAPLPSVRDELTGIVGKNGRGLLPGVIYLDEQFTVLRLREVTESAYKVMHIASHFVSSPGTEENSYLLMGDGEELTLSNIRTEHWNFGNLDLLTLSACDTGVGGGRDPTGKEIEGFGVAVQRGGAKGVLATLWKVADHSTAVLMQEFYRHKQDGHLSKAEALRQAQIGLLKGTISGVPSRAVHHEVSLRGEGGDNRATSSQYAHPFYWAPFILMGNWL